MKIVTKVMAAIAMLAVGSASMGCVQFLLDEPTALDNMID